MQPPAACGEKGTVCADAPGWARGHTNLLPLHPPAGRVFLHPSSVNFACGKFESGWLAYSEIVETSKVRGGGGVAAWVRVRHTAGALARHCAGLQHDRGDGQGEGGWLHGCCWRLRAASAAPAGPAGVRGLRPNLSRAPALPFPTRRQVFVRESSMVPVYAVLLFGGEQAGRPRGQAEGSGRWGGGGRIQEGRLPPGSG